MSGVSNGPMLKAAGLWAKSSVKGGQYLTGRLGGVKVLVLENRDRQTDDDPSHHLFFVEAAPRPERREGGQERGDGPRGAPNASGSPEAITATAERRPGACRRRGGLAGAVAPRWGVAAAGQWRGGWSAMGALTGRPAAGFGPWCDDLPADERKARVRELRVLAHIFAPRSPLVAALTAAEAGDRIALEAALTELDRLPTLPRRRLLATYAALHSPDRRKP
jgi:hypothetical protein